MDAKLRYIRFLSAGILLLLLNACTYHAGFPINQQGIKTIYVKPAINEALGAQISGVLTRQIREEILRNGFLRLADKNTADATLETIVTHYGRSIGSVREDDVNVAKTFYLNSSIKCSLRDNRLDEYIFRNQFFSAGIGINANEAAQAIEYQRMPQLTRELAKQVGLFICQLGFKVVQTSKACDLSENKADLADEKGGLQKTGKPEPKDENFSENP